MIKAPICPVCKVNECDFDSEPPGPGGYFDTCVRCLMLSGYGVHSHTYYPSPAQVAAGTYPAGHSWRTLVSLRPLWEDGQHVGFRCREFDRCGWGSRFTAEELEPCPTHSTHPNHRVSRGMCVNSREHRRARGECDERGHITEYGREQERLRSDAANWDPGRYVSR